MPKRYLTARDYVLEDNALLRLGFVDTDARSDTLSRIQSGSGSSDGEKVMASTFGPEDRVEFDLDRAVGMLRDDPGLGARLLGLSGGMEGNGDVYWAGAHAARDTSAGSFGVRVLQRREGDEVVGDNRFGEFLTEVRDAYREYLRSNVFDQVHAPDPSMVVTDFTRPGSYESDIEVRERAGEEFIHTDVYRPKGRRFDTALDGTTGHAGRAAAPEVSFQRFDCPFGTGWPSPLVVDTAAEASMLYERAIRGDLDWKALIRSFDERGALNRNLTERQKENMARDYDSQFRWMRERIATDSSLRDLQVVGASHLVADDSLGRSVYDAAVAPSPADVLRYYIENPVMLFAQSKSYVVSALQEGEKNEPQRLVVDPSKAGDVTVLVIGSDTIGGREPGGKGYSDLVKEVKYSDGQRVVTSRKAYKVPMKAEAEVERDYQAFRTRMDEVLSGVPEGVNVRLVSGSSSTMGASVGVGTPETRTTATCSPSVRMRWRPGFRLSMCARFAPSRSSWSPCGPPPSFRFRRLPARWPSEVRPSGAKGSSGGRNGISPPRTTCLMSIPKTMLPSRLSASCFPLACRLRDIRIPVPIRSMPRFWLRSLAAPMLIRFRPSTRPRVMWEGWARPCRA